jgi:hypothetical protein
VESKVNSNNSVPSAGRAQVRKKRNGETPDSANTVQDRADPVWSWRDQLIMLLHIAAATEHALMVQYLYAAYSLDVDQKGARREMVGRWQKSIIAIAREEMGHLLTVENILTLLGGPINLDREDFPWDAPYYPFPFRLEPLTIKSLSCYVFAEMPGDDKFRKVGKKIPRRFQFQDFKKYERNIREEVDRAVKKGPRKKPHRVGELYEKIIALVEDPKLIPNSAFQGATFGLQASWDDWGRGYQPDPRMLDAHGNLISADARRPKTKLPRPSEREAHVMIEQVATRTQVGDALRRIAGQGEAPHLEADETGEPSHFDRFLEIYQEFYEIHKTNSGWKPAYHLAVNPSTRSPDDGGSGHYIENQHSRDWANLFNLRYRMLLTCLAHTFQLARVTRADEPNVRAMVMHRAFGEMYNLKTIAGILVRRPLRGARNGSRRAGPPFETPYSLRLPPTESDTWWLHCDLTLAAGELCHLLLRHADESGRRYLQTLQHLDKQSIAWIDRILAGLGTSERQRV